MSEPKRIGGGWIMRLLVVEDEPELGRLLLANLARLGLSADLATDVATAADFVSAGGYDLVLLDQRLPDGNGLDLLRRLRAKRNETPVIVVSAADAVQDRVAGLHGGADDYIVKPFALDELVARIRAVLRRPGRALGVELALGNVRFNCVSCAVEIDARPVLLPRRELAALEALMRADGRVITRETLEDAIYAMNEERQSNVLESSVSRLRRRLAGEGATIEIRVVRGVGYRLVATTAAAAPDMAADP